MPGITQAGVVTGHEIEQIISYHTYPYLFAKNPAAIPSKALEE